LLRSRPAWPSSRRAPVAAVLGEYEQRNRVVTPIVRVVLSRLVGWHYDGSSAARQRLVLERPILALRPAS
jgi:hypothetical protein